MRKDKEQQKKAQAIQRSMFEKAGEPLSVNTGGTGTLRSSGVELSSRLEKQRTLTGFFFLERNVDYVDMNNGLPCKGYNLC